MSRSCTPSRWRRSVDGIQAGSRGSAVRARQGHEETARRAAGVSWVQHDLSAIEPGVTVAMIALHPGLMRRLRRSRRPASLGFQIGLRWVLGESEKNPHVAAFSSQRPAFGLRRGGHHETGYEEREDLTMSFRVRVRRAAVRFRKAVTGQSGRGSRAAIAGASSRAGRWLWSLFERRPIISVLLLAVSVAAGSVIVRGRERTSRDLRYLAWQVKEWLTISPAVEHSLERMDKAREGYYRPIIRYPGKMILLIKQAARERKDVLATYEALIEAWEAVAPDEPLAIQFVSPPASDRSFGLEFDGNFHLPVTIRKSNFEEMLPHLQQIRILILEGDGSGRGNLRFSGYEAEPGAIVFPPPSRDNPRMLSGPEVGRPRWGPGRRPTRESDHEPGGGGSPARIRPRSRPQFARRMSPRPSGRAWR
jgi:hypothetical protein